MSDLSNIEKLRLEKIFEMGGGFVLNFTNRTFQEFVFDSVAIDIDVEKYKGEGKSKANRLRAFWEKEPNNIVGKLIADLLEYWKLYRDTLITESEQNLFDECCKISTRLIEGHSNELDEVSIDAHFEEIRKEIITNIQQANFLIWVAVAWFTDKELFSCLVNKKKQGLNIQLIIVNDDINGNSGLNYEEEFETYRSKKTEIYENLMHDKFCIIDLAIVIHGSYNWTKKAQYNDEDITVLKSRKNAEDFAQRFLYLKNKAF